MPFTIVDNAHINFELLEPTRIFRGSKSAPAISLSPGGRNPLTDMRDLGRRMAASGYRVLLHDRRNCGASDVGFDARRSEYEMWADDLHGLLKHLDLLPAIVGGSSSGARLALTFALRHRLSVRALLLIRVTGGQYAADRLVEKYYDSNVRAAATAGMAAVCKTEHFAEVIRNRPQNRALLMAIRPADFIACMNAWRAPFLAGADLPLIGTTAADLASLHVPVSVIPGNDLTHPSERGAIVAPLIPDCELNHVTSIERDIDVTPAEEWGQHYPAMARIFADFLSRKLASPS